MQSLKTVRPARSAMDSYVSSKDPYGNFAATGTHRSPHEVEMDMKRNEPGSSKDYEKAKSSKGKEKKKGGKKKKGKDSKKPRA